ncbi:MAG: helix-turn-helix transcriptional regulator [bacterium]|nr:helix-turn-helix transcriptional regulator [bacterium]
MDEKTSFDRHLTEKLEDPQFAQMFQEKYKKLSVALGIANLRQKQQLTRTQLAQKIGTTQSVITGMENSEYDRYSLATLRKIAQALNAELQINFIPREG